MLIGDGEDAADARFGVGLIRLAGLEEPDGVVVRLAGVVLDTQVGVVNVPALLEVVAGLHVEIRGQVVAEQQHHTQQQEGEEAGVDGREGETQAACDVLTLRHSLLIVALWRT